MIRLSAKLVFRSLKKHKLFTFINIGGLSISLLAFSAILTYVNYQLSFDGFNEKSDRIYRLLSATDQRLAAIVPYTWGASMQQEISEIEKVASFQNITIALTVKQGDDYFSQHGFIGADSTLLDLFDFPSIAGNRSQFLHSPDRMLITPAMADKYFGNDDPIGRTLEVNLWGTFVKFEVEGVIKCPANSHIQFNFIIPIEPVKKHFFNQKAFASWTTHFAHTYFLMAEEFDSETLAAKMKDFLHRHGGSELSEKYTPKLQPLNDIFLKSTAKFDFQPRGNQQYVVILTAVAVCILLLALINFMSINSAKAIDTVKTTGLQKIMGSNVRLIYLSHFIESTTLILLSSSIACVSFFLMLPSFNDLAGTSFQAIDFLSFGNFLRVLGAILIGGLLTSIYPARVHTSFRMVSVLNSRHGDGLKRGRYGKVLVTLQFAIALFLLISTMIIQNQVDFMANKNLGFEKDQLLVIYGSSVIASDPAKMDLLREALADNPGVKNVTAASSYPGDLGGHSAQNYLPQGWNKDEHTSIWTIYTDTHFATTFGLKLAKGRDLNPEIQSDTSSILVNQAAIDLFASGDGDWLANPIGKRLVYKNGNHGNVVGVIENFHFEPLKDPINPLVIQVDPRSAFSIQMRLSAQSTDQTVSNIETTWKGLFREVPFGYRFLDQEFARYFEAEKRLARIMSIFTFIAILVAALGLFGLSSYTIRQRAREMSIRKVVGASELQVLSLVTRHFLYLIVIASCIAVPLGYYFIDEWLGNFAYRTPLFAFVFVKAIVIGLTVALVAIARQAYSIMTQNPVDVLNHS